MTQPVAQPVQPAAAAQQPAPAAQPAFPTVTVPSSPAVANAATATNEVL